MFPPACGTDDGADLLTDTSEVAAAPGWVVIAVELSLPLSSFGVPVTEAVLLNVLGLVEVFAGTATTIDTVAELLPAAKLPRLQVTVAVPVHVPCDAVADTNVTPAGNVSDTDTPVAAVFPVCDTVIE